jgi:hypothetical protein
VLAVAVAASTWVAGGACDPSEQPTSMRTLNWANTKVSLLFIASLLGSDRSVAFYCYHELMTLQICIQQDGYKILDKACNFFVLIRASSSKDTIK